MRVNNHWVLLATFLFSLPLCCLPLLYIPVNSQFSAQFQVTNSGPETIYITPVGSSGDQSYVLLRTFGRFPYIPLFKKGDLRLDPGETIRITSEADENLMVTGITVRNAGGDYRQLTIDRPSTTLTADPMAQFTIGPMDTLETISLGLLLLAVEGEKRNWLGASVIVAGVLPTALLVVWIGAFVRRPKK